MRDDNSFYSECKGCYWWRGNSGTYFCHYCFETGEPRGVKPKDCYKHPDTRYMTVSQGKKWEKEQKQQKAAAKEAAAAKKKERNTMANYGNYDIKTKEAAVKAVLLDKEAMPVICERFCVARSTLNRWVAEARKEQQKYFDYADELEKEKDTEQSRAEQSRAEQSRLSKTAVQKQTVSGEAEVGCEDMQQCDETENILRQIDKVREDRNNIRDNVLEMERVMRNFEKLQFLSAEEKQVLERLFARANGFVMGLEYSEVMLCSQKL